MLRSFWWLIAIVFISSCAFLPKTKVPILSPSGGGDQLIGYKSEMGANNSAEGEVAGGVVGKIGGDGDSVSLWIAIVVLGVVAISAYPAQRAARLGWKSWRGSPEKPRTGKGKEVCIKILEWDTES